MALALRTAQPIRAANRTTHRSRCSSDAGAKVPLKHHGGLMRLGKCRSCLAAQSLAFHGSPIWISVSGGKVTMYEPPWGVRTVTLSQ